MSTEFKIKRLRMEFKDGKMIEHKGVDIDTIDIYTNNNGRLIVTIYYNADKQENCCKTVVYSYKLEAIERYEARYCR